MCPGTDSPNFQLKRQCDIFNGWAGHHLFNYEGIFLIIMGYDWKFHPIHNKLTSLPDCIRNSKDKPLELKEIYNQLIKERYKSPRRTEGQKEWDERYNIAIPNLIVNINKISHRKGRNTLFRFFSRTLPGINYERNTTCKICCTHFRDPYYHLFFQCKEIKSKENTIISTINKLSFIKHQIFGKSTSLYQRLVVTASNWNDFNENKNNNKTIKHFNDSQESNYSYCICGSGFTI
ncbi:hypothetical protein ACTA71_002156 [Dictyostelium dimigraforme]